MKKIINGKKYDTETAKYITTYMSPNYGIDFCGYKEELYVKRTGEYFLYGGGGSMSKYSKTVGNSMCGSEAIIPLTKEEAMKWSEKYLTVEEYEKLWGEVEE